MSLEFVLGIHVLFNSVSKCIVDSIPLVNHGSGTFVEQCLNLVAHVSGSCAFTLRSLNVIVAKPGPGFRNRNAARRSIVHYLHFSLLTQREGWAICVSCIHLALISFIIQVSYYVYMKFRSICFYCIHCISSRNINNYL